MLFACVERLMNLVYQTVKQLRSNPNHNLHLNPDSSPNSASIISARFSYRVAVASVSITYAWNLLQRAEDGRRGGHHFTVGDQLGVRQPMDRRDAKSSLLKMQMSCLGRDEEHLKCAVLVCVWVPVRDACWVFGARCVVC